MSPTTVDELTTRLDEFRRRRGIPAAGAALMSVDAEPRMAVVGSRVRGGAEPVTPDDRWHIGSCGKAMTATLVARLVQRGVTRWDASVDELFADAMPDRHAAWRDITLTDLLTHRAGVAANPARARMSELLTDPAPAAEQRLAYVRGILAEPPVRPGRFLYSNLGYAVAGSAVELLTGTSYEDALTAEVLGPLGITSAGFGAPPGDQPRGHRPRWGYVGRGPAVPATDTGLPQPSDNPPLLTPAGRMHLSLTDWTRFIRVFLDPPGDLLDPASIAAITTAAPGSRQGMGWAVLPARSRAALSQQGCNVRWVATAVISRDRHHAALVVCNDGRLGLLRPALRFTEGLLPEVVPGA
jgi:CubicO group peptidase (beta-lactamase class C family)